MFSQAHFPQEPIPPEELDEYLCKGWFRMGQTIFTTNYIQLEGKMYHVIWLRIILSEFAEGKTLQKLLKLNSNFKVTTNQISITPEKEELYQKYKTGISFDTSESLQRLLFDDAHLNVYNTMETTIHDGSKLIAVGYFDIGKNSAAGICSFYDPDYKKYSLGKYLIYHKLLYCKNQNLEYFYTGYFAPGCKAFDYKLELSRRGLEFFDVSNESWSAIEFCNIEKGSVQENKKKLDIIQEELQKVNIGSHFFNYSYFAANLFGQFEGMELFDYIMFVYCFDYLPEIVNPIVVYDFRADQYHLLKCISVGTPHEMQEQPEEYSAQLLKIERVIFSAKDPKEFAALMIKTFLII